MRDQVCQGLLDRTDDAGNVFHGMADLFQHLFASAIRIRVEADEQLGDVDPLSVLVQFGPTGAARKCLELIGKLS